MILALTLNRQTKTCLLFAPLLLGLSGVGFLVMDLKQAVSETEQCTLIGRGLSVEALKSSAKLLYSNNGLPENNIALTCPQLGQVMINDNLLLPVQNGAKVTLLSTDYQYLPTRYHLAIPVINTDGQELDSTPRQKISL